MWQINKKEQRNFRGALLSNLYEDLNQLYRCYVFLFFRHESENCFTEANIKAVWALREYMSLVGNERQRVKECVGIVVPFSAIFSFMDHDIQTQTWREYFLSGNIGVDKGLRNQQNKKKKCGVLSLANERVLFRPFDSFIRTD